MSRVAKKPIIIPPGVEISIGGSNIKIKGPKGAIQIDIQEDIEVKKEDNALVFSPKKGAEIADAVAGTTRALVSNMVCGVTKGFERKLVLIGVGFKAQSQGKILNLALGFSHPIKFQIPTGITIETPSQTEVTIKGIDKHLVGQVAAKIRSFRPPEPYKGKGVRYEGEVIVQKEGKKK
ncbi:MAG: 50S ribosomal protein L6 [uncultured bacterium]|nr:MAG: 50S ribosomal protein L6 [uncultured bacterium]HBC71307.1 50S ribosomal protein L6 [Coxiellaceae bacterium]HBS51677.1 50S ribosomal protein L6 [Coxiellaceae bacterium]HBY55369.1 50S ribosomal protein L6 [Coxiellaceae bacterium]